MTTYRNVCYKNACDLQVGDVIVYPSGAEYTLTDVYEYRDDRKGMYMMDVTFNVPSRMGDSFPTYAQIRVKDGS